eukprot:GHVU01126882.1.p1 GENE.GHVU01126882.1~~GHVU01126882.1.p1  ORF type:complete len:134 (+),score=12.43 GHVU01126882.1:667-1068(+)
MEPLIGRVERVTGRRVLRLECWKNPVNYKLLHRVDVNGRCGGLPYYYNTRTRTSICGATNFDNLLAWATDSPHSASSPPDASAPGPWSLEATDYPRGTGLVKRVMRRLSALREAGQRRAEKLLVEGSGDTGRQ